jgi:hypothetical protein
MFRDYEWMGGYIIYIYIYILFILRSIFDVSVYGIELEK